MAQVPTILDKYKNAKPHRVVPLDVQNVAYQTLENCPLLFFAAYVICKKNYSFSRVVLLFFQTKIVNSFHSKMTAVGLGQQGSEAVGSGLESLACKIFLRFITNIFRYPKLVKH